MLSRFVIFLFLWLGLGSFGVGEGRLWGMSADDMLALSEAKNAYLQGDLGKCVVICKELINRYAEASDAYLLMGRIHLEKKYYRLALLNLKKAEHTKSHLLLPESQADLYMHLSATHYYLSNRPMQLHYLRRMQEYARSHLGDHGSTHYQRALGQSSFALGLFYYQENRFHQAKPYLLTAISNAYYVKICYLLLAYYYCSIDQETLNAQLKAFYTQSLKTENRDLFFQFYYKEYTKAELSPIEMELMNHPWYHQMISEVTFTARLDGEQKEIRSLRSYY